MAKSSLATKSDIVSLFQELEDASRQAKVEEKKNKINGYFDYMTRSPHP